MLHHQKPLHGTLFNGMKLPQWEFCRHNAVWATIPAASDLSQPYSVSNMFGTWLWGISRELKPLVLLGAAVTCWSLWLCRNERIIEKKTASSPLQVIYSIIHWLRTGLSFRSLLLRTWLQWPKSFLPKYVGGSLVIGLSLVCRYFLSL